MCKAQCGLSTLCGLSTMLVQFWPTVCDAGPASNQHWFSASCLLGCWSGSAYCWRRVQADNDPVSIGPASPVLASIQFWPTVCDAGPASNQHWFSASCLLGCWFGSAYCWRRVQADNDPVSIGPASPVLASIHSALISMLSVTACWRYWYDALIQSWLDVGPLSVTLAHIQRGAKHNTVILG